MSPPRPLCLYIADICPHIKTHFFYFSARFLFRQVFYGVACPDHITILSVFLFSADSNFAQTSFSFKVTGELYGVLDLQITLAGE